MVEDHGVTTCETYEWAAAAGQHREFYDCGGTEGIRQGAQLRASGVAESRASQDAGVFIQTAAATVIKSGKLLCELID